VIEIHHFYYKNRVFWPLQIINIEIKFALKMRACFNLSRWFGSSDLIMLGSHFSKAVISISVISQWFLSNNSPSLVLPIRIADEISQIAI
jgi:hypothetical protein